MFISYVHVYVFWYIRLFLHILACITEWVKWQAKFCAKFEYSHIDLPTIGDRLNVGNRLECLITFGEWTFASLNFSIWIKHVYLCIVIY